MRQCAEVHLEHIAFNHAQERVLTQAARQIAVELDHGQVPQALDQRLRERGQAGTDLDHHLPGGGCNFAHDGVDDGAVGQEVLAEALAGNVLHGRLGLAGFAGVATTSGGSRIST